MKIKKFEGYYSGDYDYEYGGHAFVLARYKDGWDKYKFNVPFSNDEFVPCMVSGNLLSDHSRHDFYIIGHSSSFNIDDFEILKGTQNGFQEMIELYTSAKKYNIG